MEEEEEEEEEEGTNCVIVQDGSVSLYPLLDDRASYISILINNSQLFLDNHIFNR